MPSLPRRFGAEFFGTFWLVFAGVGSVVIGAAFPGLGFGYLGVAFAFGLTVLTMAYAVGPISGAHLNPAVSIGLWAGGRFRARDLPVYIAAQVLGGLAGASVLYPIATGIHSFTLARGFGSNGYGSHSPGGYALGAVIVAEIVLTAFFVLVIHGATDKRAPAALAPLCDRPHLDPGPPGQPAGRRHVREPRAQPRAGDLGAWLGGRPGLGLHRLSDRRRRRRWARLPHAAGRAPGAGGDDGARRGRGHDRQAGRLRAHRAVGGLSRVT